MLKIKELREEKNLTQKELANKIDTTATNIGRWEKGFNEPAYTYLVKLADFFDVSIDYLVGREDDLGIKKYSSEHNRAALSEDESDLLKNFRKLGPFARESIIIQVNALAEKNEDRQKTF